MEHQLRLLFVEDSEDDALLLANEVCRAGFDLVHERVDSAAAMRTALSFAEWDAVLCDYNLPSFDALAALAITKEAGKDIPFIVVSGTVTEEVAVEALKAGAHDFIVKSRLARLVPAIRREIHEAEVRRDRRRALKALELAVKARDEFLLLASHELMTPLTPLELHVTAAIRLLRGARDERTSEDVAERLVMASRQIGRLTAVINNLIDATRIDSGSFTVAKQRSDLREIVGAGVGRWRGLLAARGMPIDLTAPEEVVGDWDAMVVESILSNLLSNAINFGSGKPVEVKVVRAGNFAEIAVTDHGIGIDPEAHGRIFQRFERAVPSAHYGGLGIGLWITHEAVQAHGGRIRVSSTPGKGATFVVTLPRWAEAGSAAPHAIANAL